LRGLRWNALKSDFGRPPEEFTACLAYVNFDGAAALDASREVPPDQELTMAFLETHCGESITGVTRLCEWLDGL
jgi:hypothetical protein